jgi:mannosyltransferase OCH1-like enzyme
MIEKNIIQTFVSNNLHPEIKHNIQGLTSKNPGFRYLFFDDDTIISFIEKSYDSKILSSYKKLNIGAAKADFFRYLALYNLGGVYCDMDSMIDFPIEEIVADDDQALITRERNVGSFVQWAMFFKSGHRLLERTINLCIEKIKIGKGALDEITGPKVFSQAVRELYGQNAYFENDTALNQVSKDARFFGYDYEGLCIFKHNACQFLYYPYTSVIPWKLENKSVC